MFESFIYISKYIWYIQFPVGWIAQLVEVSRERIEILESVGFLNTLEARLRRIV